MSNENGVFDVDGLTDCYKEHAGYVFHYLRKRTGDAALAEELTAVVFEQTALHFLRGRGHEVTRAWLTTTSKRRHIDHWRRAVRSEALGSSDRPEVVVLDEPSDGLIRETLLQLPKHYRWVLMRRYVAGFSVGEVAEDLGLSYRAASSLLARSRRAFRAAYKTESA